MSIHWSPKRVFLLETLKQIRLDAQLTQADLAARLTKPQSYVSKYESGERRLDVIELYEVCSAIGVSLGVVCQILEQEFIEQDLPQKISK